MSSVSSGAGASAVSGCTRRPMRGSMWTAWSPPSQPHERTSSRMASASRVIASKGPAPLRAWWRAVIDVGLQLLQPGDHHEVEARLLRVGLAELLSHQMAQAPLEPRDRPAPPARGAHQLAIGL